MAQPAVRKNGLKRYPLLRSWPMGFRTSAITAQRITDATAHAVDLPTEARFVPSGVTPLEPPLWATCLDDFVALHYQDDPCGPEWARRLELGWNDIGVLSHPKKALNAAANCEMLGFQVGAISHEISLTPAKEFDLVQALLRMAVSFGYSICTLQRVVGKSNFVHSLRPSMRSIFWSSYRLFTAAKEAGVKRVGAARDIMLELLCAALLMPLSRLSLQAPWCDRVVAHDAAPGGHGLAYTTLNNLDTRLWARWACHRGEYFLLEDADRWLRVPKDGATPLHTVDLPIDKFFWHEVAKPGGYKHICLEESDAFVWALTERFHRDGELGCRCLHLGE
jgi:hypothetical protein